MVLFCYLLAGVANWYVLRIAEPNAMGPTHVGWLGGLIQSVLFVAFWLIVASSISTALAQHETTARLLQLENQDLQSTRNHVQAQLARFAAELSQRVLHELIPTLEELTVRARELRVTSTPATILAFSAQLRSVAHDSIRPVAHRLDAELIDTGTLTRSPAEPVAARPQNRLAAITRLALTGDPIRPVGAATVGALVAILTVAAPKLAIPVLGRGSPDEHGSPVCLSRCYPGSNLEPQPAAQCRPAEPGVCGSRSLLDLLHPDRRPDPVCGCVHEP